MSLLQLFPDLTTWLLVPYKAPQDGRVFADLSGWCCWGCLTYIGRAQFGVDYGPFAGEVARISEGRDAVRNSEIAGVIRDMLPQWRGVPPRPGAVALFRASGEDLHTGLMLTPTIAIHALKPGADGRGGGTLTLDLTLDRWGRPHRFVGCYVPLA